MQYLSILCTHVALLNIQDYDMLYGIGEVKYPWICLSMLPSHQNV